MGRGTGMTTWSYADDRRRALAKSHQLRGQAHTAAPTPAEKPAQPATEVILRAGCPSCAGHPMRVIDIDGATDDGRTLRIRWECTNPACRHVAITATHLTDYSLVTRGVAS